ncbi:gastrula zinc finger protein XlCGF28.1-like isoform X3 [Adelges cooleyi]|uniref:gastrula zinc finger protein XlCGF28.1-like isoform X3 n=1 Tax=Adelges cooleyi TaxID=133065 RepID=UPI0021802DD2|nr:gastrula zinc finger protein XlCGF28.1-like isoform X3 [Adelges cooleyi]
MDDYNGTMINIEEDEDVKQYFNEVLVKIPELNHINDTRNNSPTNHNGYQKTIDELNEAGGIKIEVGETDDYHYKSIFELEEENKQRQEQQNTIDVNEYEYSESIIKIEVETDDNYETVFKTDKVDEGNNEITETFTKETKSTNIEKPYNSCVTPQNELLKSFDGNIYNNRELCNTTVVKVEVDMVDGHYYESLIEVEENGLLDLKTTAQRIPRSHSAYSSTQERSTKQVFNKNILAHSGEKSYNCEVCSKPFSKKSALKVHERLHTGEKPFKCAICLKPFSCKSYLTIHERVHTGEKPYTCAVCLKSFSHRNNLTIHERLHTGEKPYKCAVCLKSFSEKSHLTKHCRVHTGEKPYKCDICLKSFSQKFHFTVHKRGHSGENPYTCAVCLKSFSGKSQLDKHEQTYYYCGIGRRV